jgi:hypothetical protein
VKTEKPYPVQAVGNEVKIAQKMYEKYRKEMK